MSSTNPNVIVLNSVQALGADVVFSNGLINIAAQAFVPYNTLVKNYQIQPYVAGVPRVADELFVTGVSYYQITIKTKDTITSNPKFFTIPLSIAASSTALQIATAFVAIINGIQDIPVVASINSNYLRLTAVAPYYNFSVENDLTTTIVTETQITAAVQGYGLGSDILAGFAGFSGVTPEAASQIVSTNQYTQVTFLYKDNEERDSQGVATQYDQVVVYVNQGDADYITLVGPYGKLTQALAGKSATWTAGTGTLAGVAATDVITIAGSTFTGQDIFPGDVLYQTVVPVYVPVIAVTTTTTGFANVAADFAAGAYQIVQLRDAA